MVISALLRGAWRDDPGPPGLADEHLGAALERVEPQLLGAGCGALLWRRLDTAQRGALAAARPYREAYRYQTARAVAERESIATAVRTLREVGIEPLLVKGWATARHYPEVGLRPFGDLDLVVRPHENEVAARTLLAARRANAKLALAPVDLHTSLDDLADRPLDALYESALDVPLGDSANTFVRVLGAEDHLRLLAFHLLRHGAWRPLWLCDVGLIVERHGSTLDWDRCLRGTAESARRVAYVIGLAHRLLDGALPAQLPAGAARAAHAVPRWLTDATLAQWARRYDRYSDPSILSGPRDLRLALGAARRRWPNAIEATVSVGAPFNGVPRLPIQLADVVRRVARLVVARS